MNPKIFYFILLFYALSINQNAYASFKIRNVTNCPTSNEASLPNSKVHDSTIRMLYSEQKFMNPSEHHYQWFRRRIERQIRYQKSWIEGLSITFPVHKPATSDSVMRKLFVEQHFRKPNKRNYRRFARGIERQIIYTESWLGQLALNFAIVPFCFSFLLVSEFIPGLIFLLIACSVAGTALGIAAIATKNETRKGFGIAGLAVGLLWLFLLAATIL